MPQRLWAETPKFKVPRFTRPLSKWLDLLSGSGFGVECAEGPHLSEAALRGYPQIQDAWVTSFFFTSGRGNRESRDIVPCSLAQEPFGPCAGRTSCLSVTIGSRSEAGGRTRRCGGEIETRIRPRIGLWVRARIRLRVGAGVAWV